MKWVSYFDEPHELVGWAGALAILTAYALGSFGVLSPESLSYQGLNIVGSFGILYNTWKVRAYPSVVLNGVWAVLGLIVFFKILF